MEGPSKTNNDKVEALIDAEIDAQTLHAVTLSGPRQTAADGVRKVVVKPILLRGERVYQFAYHAAQKVTHRNLAPEAARSHLRELLGAQFRQGLFTTDRAETRVTFNKRGEVALTSHPTTRPEPAFSHDRKKQHLLPEGQPVDFLIRLGVMSANGKVIAAKYDKFRQINRFLEMVDDVAGHLPSDRPLRIVDFGSGKSYLTFALYHYLRHRQQREVEIVGLDRKADVIAHCSQIARDLSYNGLRFVTGDIQSFQEFESVDMVVTLHACDTATDDALARAVTWGARVILSVPCCQHELFRQLHSDVMRPMLKHGILRERLTALVTDSLRASLLELAGYSVQILEFIALEHTAKNLLIRAMKSANQEPTARRLQEYRAFRDAWHVHPFLEASLEKILGDSLEGTQKV